MMSKPPCKDCPDRVPACHDKCERYAEFKSEQEQIKVRAKAAKEFAHDVEFRARQLMLKPKRRHE